jgi:hypothetical protein
MPINGLPSAVRFDAPRIQELSDILAIEAGLRSFQSKNEAIAASVNRNNRIMPDVEVGGVLIQQLEDQANIFLQNVKAWDTVGVISTFNKLIPLTGDLYKLLDVPDSFSASGSDCDS